jgi:DNA polymerase III subunit beta
MVQRRAVINQRKRHMTTTITLPQSIKVDLLKAALLFTSTEETRYYLRGVHMRRRGHTLRIAATDGHRLFCAMQDLDPLLLGGDFDAILPTDGIKKALQGLARYVEKVDMDITGDNDKATRATLNEVGMTPINHTFPDIGRVVPREVSGAVAQFNPAYIGDIGKAAKILGQKMRIGHNGYGPALVTFGNMCNAFAVLMPMTSPSAHDLSPSHIRYTLGEFREGEVKLAA